MSADNYAVDRDLFAPWEPSTDDEDVIEWEDETEPTEATVEDVVSTAVRYARFGLRVFPVLRSAEKAKDKKPPPGFKWKDRSSDRVANVVEEFTAAVQDHGEGSVAVAWALGLDGYCAVDDDNGLPAELEDLLAAPHAVNVTKRGCHRIYRQPAGMTPGNSTTGFPVQGWGEFRGVGGYVVITGADRPGLDVDQLATTAEFPRPDWLRDAGESVSAVSDAAVEEFFEAHRDNGWPRGLEIVLESLDDSVGSRHESLKNALPWAMRDARAGFYPAAVAEARLREWWRSVMADDPGRREGPEFAALTSWAVACALAASDAEIRERHDKVLALPPVATQRDRPIEEPSSWSDAVVADTFGVTLRGRWLYCRALGGWQEWDGRRWRTDPGEAVFEEFRRWILAVGDQIWRREGMSDAMKAAGRYRDRGKMDAAVTVARRLDGIAARSDEFDQHPHLLNCTNGVVDLRTGRLNPHDPTLRIRQIAGADYRPDAVHHDIETVLAAMTDTTRAWVQKLVGSAAVGSVVDDVVAVFDGTGSNGKTTFLKACADALGDYATPCSTRLLIARAAHDEHPTLIADLYGRRLVFIEETPEGGALRMEQLKALSGGTPIKARFIGKDQFTFTPTHQFIVATNHRPAVNASDYAAWRRLRLVPFPRTFRKPHEAGDNDLVADLGLRGRLTGARQREAMLAWIVAGAVAWHRHGLGGCVDVEAATDEWRRSEDVIEAWWADCVTPLPTAGMAASDVYRSFKTWCEANGRRPPSNKEFVKKLVDHELYTRHGIGRVSRSAGNVFTGLNIAPEGLL